MTTHETAHRLEEIFKAMTNLFHESEKLMKDEPEFYEKAEKTWLKNLGKALKPADGFAYRKVFSMEDTINKMFE